MTKTPFSYIYNPSSSAPRQTYKEIYLAKKSSPLKNSNMEDAPAPHTLDTTPPHLILKTTLAPLFRLAKYIGNFPIHIDEDGVASFRLGQFAFGLYIFWCMVFIGLSAYYSRTFCKKKLILKYKLVV